MSAIPIPVEIQRDDHQIVLKWSAHHETTFSARDLRLACQCAQCRDEMTGRTLLNPSSVPEDVRSLLSPGRGSLYFYLGGSSLL